MYPKRKKRNRQRLLILMVLLVVNTLIGATIAKYIKTSTFGGNLTFQAKLADSIQLLEHRVQRKPDGSYELGSETVTENTYFLIPGEDIPKDPHVVITNKTSIEAYLYVEVADRTENDAIVWHMDENWLVLEGVTGKQANGTVYVYTDGKGNPIPLIRNEGDITIYLLQDNKIQVGQKLLAGKNDNILEFYAAMGEVDAVTDGTPIENAKAIYNNHITDITP